MVLYQMLTLFHNRDNSSSIIFSFLNKWEIKIVKNNKKHTELSQDHISLKFEQTV